MTTGQIGIIIFFVICGIAQFILYIVANNTKGREMLYTGLAVIQFFSLITFYFQTVAYNQSQKKNPCPQLEKVENVYRIK